MNELKKKFFGNMFFALLAQSISLIVSLIMSVLVPKLLSVNDFAFWQLFIFYTNYVNISQLGIVDGLYLKLGGKRYDELDFSEIHAQYRVFCLWQLFLAIIICVISYMIVGISSKFFIFVSVAIYMVVYNLSRFLGYIFQATNNTQWFSKASIIDRISILVLGMTAIITRRWWWQLFVCIYILGISISLIYTWKKGKNIVVSRNAPGIRISFLHLLDNSKTGMSLMVSNIASMMVLGIGRQGIESHWGIEVFGKVSFALSITNFFLMFINQISLVMFPALRKMDEASGEIIFAKAEYMFSMISPIIYILCIPVALILSVWLPQYSISLTYLMILMPLCVFDGKMQLLYNTYMKVLRQEKKLLAINLLSVLLSAVLTWITVFKVEKLYVLLYSMIVVISLRSIVSCYAICKYYGRKVSYVVIWDIIFALLFIVINMVIARWYISLSIIGIVYIVELLINRRKIIEIIRRSK